MRPIDANALTKKLNTFNDRMHGNEHFLNGIETAKEIIENEPTIDAEPHWIPCGERLPENMEPVNITWVNRDPEPYYMNIKDKPFTATGIYFRGKWYWYSVTCEDMLGEYGENEIDEVDNSIEIVAWMPLPKPYEVEE